MKSISIFYFSGTWGTEEIVKEIRDRISPACKVSLKSIEEHIKADKIPELNEDYTGFAFPIYAFNAPTLVYDFFKRLPDGKGHPCFILNVSGAGGEKTSNAASTHYVKKTLHKKNYDIVYEASFALPSNWADAEPHAKALNKVKAALEQCQKTAEEIRTQKRKLRPTPSVISRLITLVGKAEHFGAGWFGEGLYADENCISCGLCAEKCPTDTIVMKEGHPDFGKKCIFCMRCIYDCPEKAIHARRMAFSVLKNGYDIRSLFHEARR